MDTFQPLSVRRGQREPDEPFDGLPPHLMAACEGWLRVTYGWERVARAGGIDRGLVTHVALRCRIPLSTNHDGRRMVSEIMDHCRKSAQGHAYLDVLDATLRLASGKRPDALKVILEAGGSAWTVAVDGQSLESRVDRTATRAAADARKPGDEASDELAEAWSKAHGREPDPSDSWDHSIKAVEAVLSPIVVPANTKATLGVILKAMEDKPTKWTHNLNGGDGVNALIAMLRLMWPNPDRHGGNAKRTPTLAEAAAVVQMAVTIVQWCRRGVLTIVPGA